MRKYSTRFRMDEGTAVCLSTQNHMDNDSQFDSTINKTLHSMAKGTLMYLLLFTKPDLCSAIGHQSECMESPTIPLLDYY